MGTRFGIAIVSMGLLAQGCSETPRQAELDMRVNGETVGVPLNQPVSLTLRTIGPGQFGTPVVSSPAVRFEGVTAPAAQTPGGAAQVYHFRAVTAGTTLVTIPHERASMPFTVTFSCCG